MHQVRGRTAREPLRPRAARGTGGLGRLGLDGLQRHDAHERERVAVAAAALELAAREGPGVLGQGRDPSCSSLSGSVPEISAGATSTLRSGRCILFQPSMIRC